MDKEFERALADGRDLDPVRARLIEQAHSEHRDRLAEIEQDFQSAQLIRFGLSQPPECPGYQVAKGLVRWYRRKHPSDNRIVHDLKKMVWEMDHPQTEERSDEKNGEERNDGVK